MRRSLSSQPQSGCVSPRKGELNAAISLLRLHSSGLLNKTSRAVLARPRHSHETSFTTWWNFENAGLRSILTGGVEDHVHMLARFGRTITQAGWVKELKRVSNLWLKEECGLRDFEWQGGYADFSVSESNLQNVKRYIAQQEQHHIRINFQEEPRELLLRHHLEWDERYLWD